MDEIAESDCLQFTAEVWKIEEDKEVVNDNLKIVNDDKFPYLDMEMYWNKIGELKFQVHLKPNQKLKYLNNDSTHLPSNFRAIPSGVLNQLSHLTSKSKALEDIKLDTIYPDHAKALQIAGIAPKIFPAFKEIETLRNLKTKEEREELKREKNRRRKRQIFFVLEQANVQ